MSSPDSSTTSPGISEALAYTAECAKHYENFTVVSLLLPRRLRQHFFNVYAFCRHADDLADEIADKNQSLKLLGELRQDVQRMYGGTPEHMILVALQQTVREFGIPADPFLKLISAFEQDQAVARYETFEQLHDYCRFSADPVGHLVLYLCGYSDAQRQELSDFTCTALQLTNFWQDVSNDLERGRIYIPREDMQRFRVEERDLLERRFSPAYAELMRFEVDRTAEWFSRGEALLPLVNKRVRTDVALYGRGGRAILQAIRRIDYNTVQHRPTLSRWSKFALLGRYLVGL